MADPKADSGPAINAVIWLLFALALIAIGLRIHARTRRHHKLDLSDYIMSLSLLLDFVSCVCASIAVSHGVGKHLSSLRPEQIPPTILWGIMATGIGIMSDVMPKLAIALLINKVLAPSPFMRHFNVAITTVLICFGIALNVVQYVRSILKGAMLGSSKVLLATQEQCQPIAHQWEREKVPGSCWTPLVFAYLGIAVGIYSSLIDLLFCVYPLVIISRLTMQLRKKITVMVIFSLGAFTLFATVYKTASELPKLRYERVDFPRVVGQVILWTSIEGSVVIVAGSIPTWGWVFRTETFERIVSWLTLHSIGTPRASAPLASQGAKDGNQAEQGIRPEVHKEDPSGSFALFSIDRIERAAFS
ncbi:MAG: hypothetical protein Q9219_003670 [cf. Caloplaca sp. 3 TL-2023]